MYPGSTKFSTVSLAGPMLNLVQLYAGAHAAMARGWSRRPAAPAYYLNLGGRRLHFSSLAATKFSIYDSTKFSTRILVAAAVLNREFSRHGCTI